MQWARLPPGMPAFHIRKVGCSPGNTASCGIFVCLFMFIVYLKVRVTEGMKELQKERSLIH